MSKLNEKPLSQVLEEIAPCSEGFIALTKVAIVLAKALENINSVKKIEFEAYPAYWAVAANGESGRALARAKDIIGGE